MSAVLNLTAQTLDVVCHDGDLGERLSSVLWDDLKVHKQDCTHIPDFEKAFHSMAIIYV